MAQEYYDEGEKLRRWLRSLDRPQRALKQIGVLMVAESTASFKKQQFGRKKWQARAPINVYGIIADLTISKKPPSRRFDTRPALRDTGQMSRTIDFDMLGAKEIEVGSNLPYSGVLNFGGAIESEPITQTVQSRLARWLRTQTAAIQKKLAWLGMPSMTGKTLKGEVPSRPFVGFSKQTVEDIIEVVGTDLLGED